MPRMGLLVLLAAAAAILSGHQPAVVCGPPPITAWAVYDSATTTIVLDDSLCNRLQEFVNGRTDYYMGQAVLAFTHETMHASLLPDWTNETLTECRALHEVGVTTVLLLAPDKIDPVILGRVVDQVDRFALQAHRSLRANNPAYATAPCDAVVP